MILIVTLTVLRQSRGKLRYCPFSGKTNVSEETLTYAARLPDAIDEFTQQMIDAYVDMGKGEKLISVSHLLIRP